jgi:unsaturated chondroitin disaccharide hydrolase
MIAINVNIKPEDLADRVIKVFALSNHKLELIDREYAPEKGAPVFTVKGKYTSRGWTEWTQGFQYGSEILQYDATDDAKYLSKGREHTLNHMAAHASHTGVHDHGFNIISTYGNLLRLLYERRISDQHWDKEFYKLALKLSGAVQASRWTSLPGNLGYVYSFNGPHSLFADTIRSMRVLAVSHGLGHFLMGEQEQKINLLERMLQHMETTAQYNVYYGAGRDLYDIRGRVAHETIFNLNSRMFRCPNSQQGYSSFTTWTRGLAWIMLGYSEELEFLSQLPEAQFNNVNVGHLTGKNAFLERFAATAEAVLDFYIEHMPSDGIPYWDTGAPGLANLGNWREEPADPYNAFEPVDSSAAVIAAQGLLRYGQYLKQQDKEEKGKKYVQTGLTIAQTLFDEPYLSTDENHQGLLLHTVYHRPNGWDYIPEGKKVPSGESCMWGDYHLRELALYLKRLVSKTEPYYTFFHFLYKEN